MADPTAPSKNALLLLLGAVCLAAAIGFVFWNRKTQQLAAAVGTVTLDDKPLDNSVIMFFPIPPLVSKQSGAEIKHGKFTIDSEVGLASGDYRVEIHTNIPPFGEDGKPIDRATAKKLAASLPNIPRRYRTGSTLKVTATPEKNQFDFQLTSKPGGSNISSSQ
jgi:hypothetical protein